MSLGSVVLRIATEHLWTTASIYSQYVVKEVRFSKNRVFDRDRVFDRVFDREKHCLTYVFLISC